MIRLLIGSAVGAVAMFVVGFLFFVSPLRVIGLSAIDDAAGAAVQVSLAQNLPHTGRYYVPNPGTAQGAILYGRGPVATIDFNSGGFGAAGSTMIGGLIQEAVVALLIGLSLYAVAGRVTDFPSRARLVVGFSAAATLLIVLGDPIWLHADWRYALYAFVGDLAMLCAGGLVIARWFLPRT